MGLKTLIVVHRRFIGEWHLEENKYWQRERLNSDIVVILVSINNRRISASGMAFQRSPKL
jgi:hypothetical protein